MPYRTQAYLSEPYPAAPHLAVRACDGIRTRTDGDLKTVPLPLGYVGLYPCPTTPYLRRTLPDLA